MPRTAVGCLGSAVYVVTLQPMTYEPEQLSEPQFPICKVDKSVAPANPRDSLLES